MCGHGEYYGQHGHGGCCCQPGGFHGHHFRQYAPSWEERIARMEEYLKDLQAEVKNVEERLAVDESRQMKESKPVLGGEADGVRPFLPLPLYRLGTRRMLV